MSATEHRKRLMAILAADAAGYSRLMAADESATVSSLDAARAVFWTQIESNQGRVIDMAGDSVLAVFELATGAVTAALAIQQELEMASSDVPADRHMHFRIGVHLGEIIEKADGSVYGDGVNIAARLEGLAEPGGITISESVRAAVKGKVRASFEDQGEQTVKNIVDPVRAYRVLVGRETPSSPSLPAAEIDLSLPDKPSIAVLPFTNMSGDPEQEYFADGIVEDIITELTRFRGLFVIARNTSFTYKGHSVDVKKVAAELGVHFVLEGSVRKAGNRVRITAQLIDGETGRHVWAERYEDILSDVFELQERVTRQVVGSMAAEIEDAETRLLESGRRRFTESDDIAWRATKAMNDAIFAGHPAGILDAIRLAETAIGKDPKCIRAWFMLALSHGWRIFSGWTQDRAASLEAARRAADALMALAPNDSRFYLARGQIETFAGNFDRGLADLRKAHELNPNHAVTLFTLSWTEAAEGNVAVARELATRAIRLSPKDRWIGVAHLAHATAAFIDHDLPQLRASAEIAIQSHPTAPIRRVLMIAYAAESGEEALLKTHLEAVNGVAPDFIPSLFRGDYRPFHRPEHMKLLLDSLRKAGLGA